MNLTIPDFKYITNYGLNSFDKTARLIDKLEVKEKEWLKTKILIKDNNYLKFIKKILRINKAKVQKYFNDFNCDEKFKSIFSKKLFKLENNSNPWGDIRFHSLTLYLSVRSIRPNIVLETGVASGKSTALMLLALEHNQKGRLLSIDLPNKKGRILADGGKTHTDKYQVGWLVPEYLKKRWKLYLGDSKKLLLNITPKSYKIDIFLHDSLHTYEHVKFELKTIWPKLAKNSLILCDNINLGAGKAFNEFLSKHELIAYAYRDFAGVKYNGEER